MCWTLYLDDGKHSLIIVRVGVDLKALRRISVNDGVKGPPGSRGWIISVVNAQVDHDTGRALLHICLELRRHADRAATPVSSGDGFAFIRGVSGCVKIDCCPSLNTGAKAEQFHENGIMNLQDSIRMHKHFCTL